MECNEALLIFARFPRLGRVKTRLSTHFTQSEILHLYRAFLLDTVSLTASLPATRFLYLADCSQQEAAKLMESDPQFGGVEFRIQQGFDLGDRMWNAYRQVARKFRRVIYLGADTPALPPELIAESFERLRRRAVVIGPSTDGGYYLLGLAAPRRQLFEDIPWGTAGVLTQSMERLPSNEVDLLPAYSDVDTGEDLDRLRAFLSLHPGRAPHTAQVLNELATP